MVLERSAGRPSGRFVSSPRRRSRRHAPRSGLGVQTTTHRVGDSTRPSGPMPTCARPVPATSGAHPVLNDRVVAGTPRAAAPGGAVCASLVQVALGSCSVFTAQSLAAGVLVGPLRHEHSRLHVQGARGAKKPPPPVRMWARALPAPRAAALGAPRTAPTADEPVEVDDEDNECHEDDDDKHHDELVGHGPPRHVREQPP